MQLSQICEQVNGTLQGADVLLQNVSINTREDCDNRLFVALKGENFDAHDFVEQAASAGAGALMIEHEVDSELPSITVASTHQALKDLAAWWRSQFVIPVIGITGSVGKTTVKEMLKSIFAELGQGVVTKGNLNNEIGVPLTLMRLTKEDRYAIVEMGMNHAGEISRLTHIARPTIALVNNAAAAHLENLGTIAAVAKAKGEIFEGLSTDGVAVINNEDDYAELWHAAAKPHRVITFGLFAKADVTATYHQHDDCLALDVVALEDEFSVRLHTVGQHSVRNALAAIAVAMAANVPINVIASGLASYRPASGRLNILRANGVTIIDDTYNANPASMQAAIKVLVEHDNNTLIVGDMAELGESAEDEHTKLGALAKTLGVDNLYACGVFAERLCNSFGSGATAFATQEEMIAHLAQHPPSGTTLVKGSRSARMERVVAALQEIFENNNNNNSSKAAAEPGTV